MTTSARALHPHGTAHLAVLMATVAAATLVGCGGGGSGTPTPPPPPPPPSTTLTLSLGGGRMGGVAHAWVTITAVALNADATKPYDPTDGTWLTITPATPVTVDLASSDATSGALVDVLHAAGIAPGSYAQMRLLLADPDGTLVSSASAASLAWNDQVDYIDAGGRPRSVPLEIAGRAQGVALQTPFTITAGGAAYLALEWDAASSLVRRASPDDGVDRFTFRNDLRAYDRTRTGAVMGLVDTSSFCVGAPNPSCISDVTVEVQAVPPGGATSVHARSAQVVDAGGGLGAFFLYPLPDVDSVDVVLRGRHMDTMVVHGVPVTPVGGLATVPTAVSSASSPLRPTPDAMEHTVALSAATSPTSTQAAFFQTPGAGAAALELATVNTDPATGLWTLAPTLPGGPLHAATFDTAHPNATLVFTTIAPTQGLGAFGVQLRGPSWALPSALSPLAANAGTWTAPALSTVPGLASCALDVHVLANNAYDRGEVLVANDSGIVAVRDVRSFLYLLGGTASFTVPCGQGPADPLATLYTATLRVWNTTSISTTLRHVEAPGVADLRNGTTATLELPRP